MSAGVLLYRLAGGDVEVLLVHPGGPFWARTDLGAWSVPKGEPGPGGDLLDAARREFAEETGCTVAGRFIPLGRSTQGGGKAVRAWAVQGDCDPARLRSNVFSLEWPPRSGKTREFPEVDRAAWFPIADARRRINPGQGVFLDRLAEALEGGSGTPGR